MAEFWISVISIRIINRVTVISWNWICGASTNDAVSNPIRRRNKVSIISSVGTEKCANGEVKYNVIYQNIFPEYCASSIIIQDISSNMG